MNALRRPSLLLPLLAATALAACAADGSDDALPEPSTSASGSSGTVTLSTTVVTDAPGTVSTTASTTSPPVTASPSEISGSPMGHNDGPKESQTGEVCGEVSGRDGQRHTALADKPGTDCAAALAALQSYFDGMPYSGHGNAQIVEFGDVHCSAPTYATSVEQNLSAGCSGPFGGIRVPVTY
ncbi:hypothetical protein [Corynebacterium sp. UBA2622]|uniref:hypothetical protein n=1 Tax=Corynebacterium sp. UBA2622 TaxID=1946393 RepID=UPI0025C3041C|nr:hypothetical protein [Corynebacterium sp. UBA2622]